MKIHEIGQFYGEKKGWRMFDARFLTKEVKTYLDEEEEFVDHIMNAGYNQLVEIGCGYGRYLNFALGRGYKYLGLDIVPWLVDLGKLRVEKAKDFFELDADVILHPAENVSACLENVKLRDSTVRPLVLFPFNSFGNLSSFTSALNSLEQARSDIVVSTFKTDATSTSHRLEYYKNCGYENLNSRLMRQGLLIVSEEGFHAMAYNKDWLVSTFNNHGFSLVTCHEKDSVGSIYYFRYGIAKKEKNRDSSAENIKYKTIVHVVEAPYKELPTGATLLTLNDFESSLTLISESKLTGFSPVFLEKNTIVHLNMEISDSSEPRQSHDLTGLVASCSKVGKKKFELEIKLNKTKSLEKLGFKKSTR